VDAAGNLLMFQKRDETQFEVLVAIESQNRRRIQAADEGDGRDD
jgi:hypothetical protein